MSSLGRRNRAKQLESDSRSQNPPATPPPTDTPQNPSPEDNPPPKQPDSAIWKFLKRFWWAIGAILLLGAGLANYTKIADYFKSPIEKFQEAKTIPGELHFPKLNTLTPENYTTAEPKPIIHNNGEVSHIEDVKGIRVPGLDQHTKLAVLFGGNEIELSIDSLYHGINLFFPKAVKKWNTNAVFYMVAKGDRVYVSEKIFDLETEKNLLAIIDYNKFEIFKDNVIDPNYNDSMFEVKDKQGEVALSLKYEAHAPGIFIADAKHPNGTNPDCLTINGYFIGDAAIMISGSTKAFPDNQTPTVAKNTLDYKSKARRYIDSIPSIFQKPISQR